MSNTTSERVPTGRRVVLPAIAFSAVLAAGWVAGWRTWGPTTLSVTTDPDGATVSLDGVEVGRSPLEVRVWPPRTARVEAVLEGRAGVVRHVPPAPGSRMALEFELPASALAPPIRTTGGRSRLSIETVPQGAAVQIDGRELGGRTPMEEELEPGFYTVKVVLAGHESPEPRGLHLAAGALEHLVLELRATEGSVSIQTDPPGARVLVGGRPIGETPVQGVRLPEGGVQLRLELDGHVPYVDDAFVVVGGRERTLRRTLEPATGRVRLLSDPADLRLRLRPAGGGDERVERTPFAGELPVGRWRYSVEDPVRVAHRTIEGEFEVAAGASVERRFDPLAFLEERWEIGLGIPLEAPPVAADLDGDGVLEVAVADSAGTLTILSSRGEELAVLPVAEGPILEPAVADVDGDGYLDLVVASQGGALAVVSGRLRRVVQRHAPLSTGPCSVPLLVPDQDGDGAPEAIGTSGDLASALSLATGTRLWSTGGGLVPAALLADLDGDGAPEIAACSQTGVAVLDGRTGIPRTRVELEGRGPPWVRAVLAGERRLLVAGLAGGGTRAIDPASGEVVWTSEEEPISPAAAGAGGGRVLLAQGAAGLVALSAATGEVEWTLSLPTGAQYPIDLEPILADADGDGDLDVLASCRQGGTIYAVQGDSGRLLWSIQERQGLAAPPSAADLDGDARPELVVASRAGWVYASSIEPLGGHDVRPGESPAGGEGTTISTASGEAVAFGGADGRLRVVLLADGRELWSFQASAEVFARPAVLEADLVAGDFQGRLFRLGPEGGAPRWSVRLPGPVYGITPLPDADGDGLADVVVATGGEDGFVSARRGSSGEELWSWRMGDPVLGAPLISGDVLYAASSTGRVAALRASLPGERPIWERDVGEPIVAPPTVCGGELVVATTYGRVVGFDLAGGQPGRIDWRASGAVTSRPIRVEADRPILVAASADGALYAWDLDAGALAGRTALGGPLAGSPAVARSRIGRLLIVAATRKGRLRALTPDDGRLVADIPIPPGAVAAPIVLGSRIVVLTTDGAIHSLDVPEPPPVEPPRSARLDPSTLDPAACPSIERALLAVAWRGLRPEVPAETPVLSAYLAGDFARAADEAAARLEAEPGDPDRLLALGACRAAQGRRAEALALARGVSAPSPASRPLLETWLQELAR